METRLSRAEQTERNRELLLQAARRVFLERGYHAATLEQIADEAGFSKGVVYSRFRSKADLFLALLEARIEERARRGRELVDDLAGDDALAALFEEFMRADRADPAWGLLVIEFRVHAARDPELNRRYAAAHARTIDGVAELFTTLYERVDQEPSFPPRPMAELVLAMGVGARLEQAADAGALEAVSPSLLARLFAGRGALPGDDDRRRPA